MAVTESKSLLADGGHVMGHKKKKEQLGMHPSTAYARLRKMLLWKYILETNSNQCFQCGEYIKDIDRLSVEHKKPWLDSKTPIELFFDLENVAFSHLSCNIGSRNRSKDTCPQGHVYSGVNNLGHRQCHKCQSLSRQEFRKRNPEQDTSIYRREKGWRS